MPYNFCTRLLIGVVFALIAMAPVLFAKSKLAHYGQTDFAPTYIAAHLYNAGQKEAIYANEPYGQSRSTAWIQAELDLPDGTYNTVFAYSPLYLWPFLKVVDVFDYSTVVSALIVLNVLLVAVVSSFLIARLNPGNSLLYAFLVALVATSNCMSIVIDLGQNTLVVAVLLYTYFRSVRNENVPVAILSFLLAILLKPWPMITIVYPFLRRDYRMTAFLLLTLVGFTGISWVAEPELLRDYLALSKEHGAMSILAYNNYSAEAGMYRLYIGDWARFQAWENAGPRPLFIGLLNFALAGMALLAGWVRSNDYLKFFSVLLTFFLLTSVFWDHYSILFLPFVLWGLWDMYIRKQRLRFWTLGLVAFFVYYPVSLWVFLAILNTLHSILSANSVQKLVALFTLTPTVLFVSVFLHMFGKEADQISEA